MNLKWRFMTGRRKEQESEYSAIMLSIPRSLKYEKCKEHINAAADRLCFRVAAFVLRHRPSGTEV
jgi:hypothetical protein